MSLGASIPGDIDAAVEACVVQAVQTWALLLPGDQHLNFSFTFPAAGGFGKFSGRSAMLSLLGESMLRPTYS